MAIVTACDESTRKNWQASSAVAIVVAGIVVIFRYFEPALVAAPIFYSAWLVAWTSLLTFVAAYKADSINSECWEKGTRFVSLIVAAISVILLSLAYFR